MLSDTIFTAGLDEYLEKRLSAKAAPTYTYIFDFLSTTPFSKMVGSGYHIFGVGHADELQFLFPVNNALGIEGVCEGNCLTFRHAFVEMWVNFAIHGCVFLDKY